MSSNILLKNKNRSGGVIKTLPLIILTIVSITISVFGILNIIQTDEKTSSIIAVISIFTFVNLILLFCNLTYWLNETTVVIDNNSYIFSYGPLNRKKVKIAINENHFYVKTFMSGNRPYKFDIFAQGKNKEEIELPFNIFSESKAHEIVEILSRAC